MLNIVECRDTIGIKIDIKFMIISMINCNIIRTGFRKLSIKVTIKQFGLV